VSPIGIERVNYFALNAKDPEAAAKFAAERLGFTLEHAAADGTYYLSAHGVDRYSLVYKPGETHGLHHVSYLVSDEQVLDMAGERLTRSGVEVTRHLDQEWESKPALRFSTPAGHVIELTTGVHTDIPVAHLIEAPKSGGAKPVVADHLGLGAADFEAEDTFMKDVLGQLHSSTVMAGDVPVMSFMRAPGRYLFHDVVVVRMPETRVHHLQFSLKNLDQFYETADALQANDVKIEWGPLRHGAAHNVAMYFRDFEGYWLEYSCEEQIILHDPTFVPRTWSVTDPHASDEWNSGAPPAELLGPPPADALVGTDLDETFGAAAAQR
jgi:catechol 2,3-dioxygenase